MNKPARGLLVSLTTLCAGIVLTEIVLRRVAPVPDPYEPYKNLAVMKYLPSQFKPDEHLTFHPEAGLPGMKRETHFTTNNRGFRGDPIATPKPPGEFRVFTVGGSAMECLLLDDAEAIGRVLQEALAARHLPFTVKVYGAAKSGAASFDDIAMTVHRFVFLEPDLVIDLTGVNDMLASIQHYDYLHDNEELRFSLTLRYMATEFQIARRGQAIAKRILKAMRRPDARSLQELPLYTDLREKVAINRARPPVLARPRLDTSFFQTNLRTLDGVARAHHFRMVFVTQPDSWNSPDPRARSWHWMTFGFKEEFLASAAETMNDATRAVAAETSAPIYDFAKVLPGTMDYFYDDVHFNASGARALGTGLASFLVTHDLVSRN